MDQTTLLVIHALTMVICLQSSTATVGRNTKGRDQYQWDVTNQCSDVSYKPDVRNVECFAEQICVDVAHQCSFECIEYRIECCRDSQGNVTLQNAPRGTMCCPGAGMYSPQTHSCWKGRLVENESTRSCPNSATTQYNVNTQICCEAPSPGNEPNVYLRQDDFICCGGKYVHRYGEGCCANKPFNIETQCCKNGVVELSSSCRSRSTSGCGRSQSLDCSDETMKSRLESWNATAGFHVTVFEVGTFKENRKRSEIKHLVTSAKQLTERNTKLQTVSTRTLRSISFPACNCFGTLQPGEKYILLSKTKLRKNMRLREKKYFILTLGSSDVFTLLFEPST